MHYVIASNKGRKLAEVGGKAKALAAFQIYLATLTTFPASFGQVLIPAWFVLSPRAFYDSLNETQRAELAGSTQGGESQTLLAGLRPNPAIQVELRQALQNLCPHGEPVALRSSALDEDGVGHSFAGQLESFLSVALPEVIDKIVAVWRSGFSERVLTYRRENRLPLPPPAPAVIIQRMVNPGWSGVAFSADPVSGRRDKAVVVASPGLGAALVAGEVDGETYYVDRQGRVTADRRPPAAVHEAQPATVPELLITPGHSSRITPHVSRSPLLPKPHIQAIAALARQAEQVFDRPQDIEWAIEGEQIYLLQARPITSLPNVFETDGALNLWDNSNIAESYPGLTTPLTFSFARRAYEEVYRQFCRLMGVPEPIIASQHVTFRRMLGYIHGRIYYNLLSWYRVLALLPGYRVNRRFMEQMMGVRESLPDELLNQTTPSRGARLRDGLRLGRSVLGLLTNYILLPRQIEAFKRRLDHALGAQPPELSRLRPDELAAYYRHLEGQLLTRWDAPLVNDFFAMIFYGLLRKLAETWAGDPHGTRQNELLQDTGGIISAEPAERIRRLARLAAPDPALIALLREGDRTAVEAYLPRRPAFEAEYRAYLNKFGERCLEELKLESPTLQDDPLPLFRAVGRLGAALPGGFAQEDWSRGAEPLLRSPVPPLPCSNPLRRLIFRWVLKQARMLLRNRENLRFERTRLFGRARQIFLAFGRQFHHLELLDNPRDIFYLEVEEILGLVEGTASTTDLRALVRLRQAELARYRQAAPPPDRFETHGMPALDPSITAQFPAVATAQANNSPFTTFGNSPFLQGLGCSPGFVRGPVRLVTDPKTTALQPGEIIVAERTDPGWILLFPAAAGLLIEHGSLLSHAAIVSRELNLPAITRLSGLTHWLRDGEWVEMDGRRGTVRKIEMPEQADN